MHRLTSRDCAPGRRRGPFRRAFTFVEILFAVMLLGIGFILVAAALPVAIVQSQETLDQTIATQVAKGASEYIEAMASPNTLRETANGIPNWNMFTLGSAPWYAIGDTSKLGYGHEYATLAWEKVRGHMIHSTDPRYAWVAAYTREIKSVLRKDSPYVEATIWVTRSRIRDRYTQADLDGARPNLRLREVLVFLQEGTKNGVPGPDIAEFYPAYSGDYANVDVTKAVAEGTFLLISDDQQEVKIKVSPTSGRLENSRGMCNGRVYRVGSRRLDLGPNKWELMPGWDMPSGPGCGGAGPDGILNTADDNQNIPVNGTPGSRSSNAGLALIMGRQSTDASDASSFDGPAQDVMVFQTYVKLVN
jgi:type II secretory pathway pseudopilin PulG